MLIELRNSVFYIENTKNGFISCMKIKPYDGNCIQLNIDNQTHSQGGFVLNKILIKQLIKSLEAELLYIEGQ